MLIFDFPDSDGRARRLTFDAPLDVLIARDASEVRGVLRAVEAATRRGLYAAGFVTYEAAPAFDPAHVVHAPGTLPLAWFGVYAAPSRDAAETAADAPSAAATADDADDARSLELEWQPAIDRATYDTAVASIREAIAEGDVYQVNYTFPLRAPLPSRAEADHRALYERLARGGHGRYGAYLDIGTHRLLSFSPELFFSRTGDHLVCRPMKGTIARGRWPEEDAARAQRLQASEKDRAENVMIVDLVRNDLGRVAEIGSVRVSSLCELERYSTVWQMTSTIEARARSGTTLEDIFAALFPCGSVTGAPKISAVQRIADLESSPRGLYCGAIGVAGPDRAVFNVAIRTMTIELRDAAAIETEAASAPADVSVDATADYRVGGGVTWDSTARDEYAEALSKAALLRPAPRFALLETMRLDVPPDAARSAMSASTRPAAPPATAIGKIARLERHLARLTASAHDRDIPIDVDAIRARLLDLAAAQPGGSWRLRLLVSSHDGRVEIEVHPAHAPLSAPARVALAAAPVDEEDWFLCHKTTHRAVYESHRAAASPDTFDVLLWNRRGELTEFTFGNLVISLDGRRYTPPRASGLLGGTFRAELLERGEMTERVLTRDDLHHAEGIWLINSVREWVPVVLVDGLVG